MKLVRFLLPLALIAATGAGTTACGDPMSIPVSELARVSPPPPTPVRAATPGTPRRDSVREAEQSKEAEPSTPDAASLERPARRGRRNNYSIAW